ncbi:PREDICTED: calcium-binding protein NCS-1-like [Amphimedon queenslandica]|uniref:EF-hand domain-containing protein n=1 Tax=Amphimedon queenslandica TaxID=400682 RepID=A0A1X7ULV4_AMPQE|nr:PREDICTED: calcium-binding protein NCS-1-like [Amphimedon queenslandica]|eukprot:XP_003387412.1 PREDICTED: calcium-binding protein NCS-1-like [Amphimedon queenslandica]
MGKKQSKISSEDVEDLLQTTHFTAKELQKWYQGFLKDCPKGVLEKQEFCRIYQQFFPFGDPSTFAGYVFNSFDTDRDGVVAFKEFMYALSVTSRGTPEEKLNWSFKLYDINCDGFISKDEMSAIVDSLYRMVGRMIIFDNKEDTPQKRVKAIFESMDLDGDGRISQEDFLTGAQQDPIIMRSLNLFEGIV